VHARLSGCQLRLLVLLLRMHAFLCACMRTCARVCALNGLQATRACFVDGHACICCASSHLRAWLGTVCVRLTFCKGCLRCSADAHLCFTVCAHVRLSGHSANALDGLQAACACFADAHACVACACACLCVEVSKGHARWTPCKVALVQNCACVFCLCVCV
jgi:hypothetical protein